MTHPQPASPLGHDAPAGAPDRKSVLVTAENGRAFQASAGRRWGSRITDAVVELAPGVAILAVESTNAWPDWGHAVFQFLLLWALLSIIVGAAYGRGYSPGQLLFSTKSRRTRDGRVIGAWRGICRHFAFVIMPILIAALFENPPAAWDDEVMCTDRDVYPAHPHLAEPAQPLFPQS